MQEQIAKIRKVFLGVEDHGNFTCTLELDYGGAGQGAGMYTLDRYDEESSRRVGTVFGMEWIIRLMAVVGADNFKNVEGSTVIAIREDGYHGRVVGLKPLPTERGTPFLFDDLVRQFGY